MQLNQLKTEGIRKLGNLSGYLKMKLGCFAAVTMRALCPYEDEVERGLGKNREIIFRAILYFSLSFLLGLSKLKMGYMPFGLAMLCTTYGQSTLFCFTGASIASLFEGTGGLIQFITFFLVFLLRKSITNGGFDEALTPRLITAFFSSSFIGACSLFSKGFDGNALLSYLTYILLSCFCVFLFSGVVKPKKEEVPNSLLLLSVYSLCVCLTPAFNRLSFKGLDLGLIFACFISLWICRCKGPVYGCVAGFILGFTCQNPLFSAPLGIGSLISGYLMTKNLFCAVLSFPVSTLFVYFYLFGLSKAELFIPFTAAGTLIYLALCKRLPDIAPFSSSESGKDAKEPTQKNNEFLKVSDSLSGLSAVLYKFAEHMKSPANAETAEVIDNAFSKVCESCSMKNMCYAKRECNFPAVKSKIISILHSRSLVQDELSSFLLHKCIKTNELCSYINLHYSELHFMTMKSNRTQTAAALYNSMSRLLRSTSKQESDKNKRDENLEKTISDALKRIGVEFTKVTAKGSRYKEIRVHGIRPDKIPCSSKELSEYLSDECKFRFSEPFFDISDSAEMVMTFTRDTILSVDYAQCCEPKEDESVNGDTVSFFENDKGFFYTIIADGMGSGKAAAATSRLSCVFLEKMLSAGTAKNVCIEMLNNLLLSKNDETFSGLDLLEIDRLSGSAYFIKAGAAPSFVLRKSRLYKICSETPPVGIIPSFSAESTRFSLEKGDVIIMVSDGVIESDADAVWLSELIGEDTENEPAYLAKRLIEKSEEVSGRHDDASACVIRIN